MVDSILRIFAVISSWFTPEKVKERRRNEIAKLEKERDRLLQLPATPGNARRMERIKRRLRALYAAAAND